MPKRGTSKAESHQPAESPWWLEGDEACGFCFQNYAVELEIRCFDCDRPVCPFCVATVRKTQHIQCPECAADEEAEAE